MIEIEKKNKLLVKGYPEIDIFSAFINKTRIKFFDQPLLVVLPQEEMLDEISNILPSFCPEFYIFSPQFSPESIRAIKELITGKPSLVITVANQLKEKIKSVSEFLDGCFKLQVGEKVPYLKLEKSIIQGGYQRKELVEEKGDFSPRGEVFDLWSPLLDYPFRLIFEGDLVEEIKLFNPLTQLSIKKIDFAEIVPANINFARSFSNFSAYLPPTTLFCYYQEIPSELKDIEEKFPTIVYSYFTDCYDEINPLQPLPLCAGQIELIVKKCQEWAKNKYNFEIFTEEISYQKKLAGIFSEISPNIIFKKGFLKNGFISETEKKVVLSQNYFWPKLKIYSPTLKKTIPSKILKDWTELHKNDYVVHEKYGIGKYLGVENLTVDNTESEFLVIEYKYNDKLYVPIEEFAEVSKYLGLPGVSPRISSLDDPEWKKVKKKISKNLEKIASQLIEVEALRKTQKGFSFSKQDFYEEEFADRFPYEETEGQKKAIKDVLLEMERPYPMDRLVCGDAGYGKTEIAMRAALRAVLNGKQVALVAPTTILVEQHFERFKERFSLYPVRIEKLSRFESPNKQKEIQKDLKQGLIDIVIGTQRLFQKDIQFFDLGLIIIDEEHLFGVKQKEKLKKINPLADVLTLTATPIPRTLSMALSGIKDLSIIDTPPQSRIPIETYIGSYNLELVKRAIQEEIIRGGQVFYIYNRIEGIERKASQIANLIPQVKVKFAHGRIPSAQLEKILFEFIKKEFSVLVSTTIVGAGMDLSNVNTMIIEDGQNFGLSQLYQLRGRIGRSDKKAYCYILYPANIYLDETAQKRLAAIAHFTALGSGFSVSLQDLQIRGAGNILGSQQHGFINALGLDLYTKMLEDAIRKTKGLPSQKLPGKAKIELGQDAYLPKDYIRDENQRINFYRRLISATTIEEIETIEKELIDRYGKFSLPVKNLFSAWKTEISFFSLDGDFLNG